jgi:serine/threonine-protein kinase
LVVPGDSHCLNEGRRGSLDASETVAIIEQVLSALGAAHAHGLVHRDVKLGNILLTHDHVAKLADFGIARSVADANVGLTATGEVMGTSRYLSPEQVSGRRRRSRTSTSGSPTAPSTAHSGCT